MLPDDDFVVLARVGAPHGIHGQLRLQVFLEDPGSIYEFGAWYLKRGHEKSFKPFSQFEVSEKGNSFYIHFPPITDRDQAKQFTHAELAVKRSDLPRLAKDEFYWSDLIGLEVVNEADIVLGHVDSLFETGANDVMVIKASAGEEDVLIPYVFGPIVLKVDTAAKRIHVRWEAV